LTGVVKRTAATGNELLKPSASSTATAGKETSADSPAIESHANGVRESSEGLERTSIDMFRFLDVTTTTVAALPLPSVRKPASAPAAAALASWLTAAVIPSAALVALLVVLRMSEATLTSMMSESDAATSWASLAPTELADSRMVASSKAALAAADAIWSAISASNVLLPVLVMPPPSSDASNVSNEVLLLRMDESISDKG